MIYFNEFVYFHKLFLKVFFFHNISSHSLFIYIFLNKKTYKVINAYKPKAENELYLRANDYVFAVGNNSNKDNIMKGN